MMKKTWLRLLFMTGVSMTLISCGNEVPVTQGQPGINEEGKLAAPFDEGLSKAELDNIPKADDHLLVKISNDKNLLSGKTLNSFGIKELNRLYASGDWYQANLKEDTRIDKTLKQLRAEPYFDMVDYDYIGEGGAFDFQDGAGNPFAAASTHFLTANAIKAWEYMKAQGVPGGDPTVTVAVIDTGVDYNHEDLRANMWTNPNEIPGNGIDDDGDGYVDDVYGANVLDGATGADAGDPMDDHGHGTHVAGIIAAANNHKGSMGIAYNCKVMAIKAGNGSGYFTNSAIARAVTYAYEHGADVINMSFGGSGISYVVQEALETAYERCVLVAAAGNDEAPNEGRFAMPSYPGAFPFVVGVMSESALHQESSFTNFDAIKDNKVEYEVYAPGEEVYSSIPNNRYAKWSGTSMAAPVVSGAAALLRSLHPDRNAFPTKAIMSRICSSGGRDVACFNPAVHGKHNIPNGLNIYGALTKDPKPEVSLYDYYTFDNVGDDNNNGIVDAGETINLGVVLKNKGGVAKDVEVRIDTLSEAGIADRYITPTIGMISMKNIGTYSLQDCGEIKDADTNKVIGVETPLQFKVADNCPNDYMCDIHVKISWKNGLDDKDKTSYSSEDTVQVVVQKGVLLPKVIDKDTTLTKDKYYILNNSMVVNEGVTLTIEPGVTIQFYASSTDKYASTYSHVMFSNNGKVVAKGTEMEEIIFKPSELFNALPITINGSGFEFEYCNFTNLSQQDMSVDDFSKLNVSFKRCIFRRNYQNNCIDSTICFPNNIYSSLCFYGTIVEECKFLSGCYLYFYVKEMNHCVLTNIYVREFSNNKGIHVHGSCYNCVFENTYIAENKATDCHFAFVLEWDDLRRVDVNDTTQLSHRFSNNIFIQTNTGRENGEFAIFTSVKKIKKGGCAAVNFLKLENNLFWGMSQEEIDNIIYDYYDDGESTILDYSQGLNNPDYAAAYPIALDAHFEDADGVRQDSIGASTYKCVVNMSRDMDTSIPLKVCFGSVYPYADYTVEGNWKEGSKTIWEGTYTFNSKYEGGINQFLIYNGRADDNHALELVRDYRLSFKIDVTSAQSMNLQASADINGVKLTWFQDDYPTVAGYNLYKSTAKDGLYTKVNKHLLNYDETEYLDKEVEPGVTYYYNFTVVLTDMSESKPSGKTVVTTYDSMAPDVYHTPISVAYLGFNLMVSATVTDNVGAQSVTLYYRVKGADTFQETLMQASNSKYSAMIPAASITSEGLEYYIDAFDGINHTYSGSNVSPHQVIVQSKVSENEKGDVDGNGTIDLYDALLTIRAANDLENLTAEQFERADLDGNGHLTANEALLILQYANGSITSFKEYL